MAETRITAGEWRGRVISTPSGTLMRPTRSMVREALFNILGPRIAGATVVDLYAGAGTVGFEALSRGAEHAVFVERDRGARQLIAISAERFGCSDRIRIVGADVVSWLRRRPPETTAAGLCFVDAPYQDGGGRAVQGMAALTLLADMPPELIVCEHHHARHMPDLIGGLHRIREARYGLTTLSMYTPQREQR